MQPDVRYAKSGGAAIAYQVVGEGEVDLVYVPDYVSNLVYGWQSPHWRTFYDALARSFRLILFDKRGPVFPTSVATTPRWRRAWKISTPSSRLRAPSGPFSSGPTTAALFGASRRDLSRATRALVLFHPAVHPDWLEKDVERDLAELRERWGTQDYCDELLRLTCPVLLASEEDRLWFANWLRVGATPAWRLR